jgi:hypothetical protein
LATTNEAHPSQSMKREGESLPVQGSRVHKANPSGGLKMGPLSKDVNLSNFLHKASFSNMEINLRIICNYSK